MNNRSVMIIAEAGVNHNGSLERALKMVEVAAEAGADIIKFQTWKTENVITSDAPKADYQTKTTNSQESQFEMLKKLELPYSDFITIKNHCDKHQIMFLSTADEIESAAFLAPLQPFFKLGSAELTDIPYLRKLAKFNKDIILSSGMGTLDEIQIALNTLEKVGLSKEKITVLHCHTAYPTNYEDVNLTAMITIRDQLNVKVGLSDHTIGTEIAIAAVAMGAKVIEKHFTLDKNLSGPDHQVSLNGNQLKKMVKAIRNIENALGDGIKKPTEVELKNMPVVRKSIVAQKTIESGDFFTENNLTVKRPGNGISPSKWDDVIGMTAKRKYAKDEEIQFES